MLDEYHRRFLERTGQFLNSGNSHISWPHIICSGRPCGDRECCNSSRRSNRGMDAGPWNSFFTRRRDAECRVGGLLSLDLSPNFFLVVVIALCISGIGAGVLQTVGPAIATDAVREEERGEAITSTGTFRAAALFLAPMGTAGLVVLLPMGVAVCIAGLAITLPAASGRWTHR